jgi:hypothetical protein
MEQARLTLREMWLIQQSLMFSLRTMIKHCEKGATDKQLEMMEEVMRLIKKLP